MGCRDGGVVWVDVEGVCGDNVWGGGRARCKGVHGGVWCVWVSCPQDVLRGGVNGTRCADDSKVNC